MQKSRPPRAGLAAQTAPEQHLMLMPYPRQVTAAPGALLLRGRVSIGVAAAGAADRFAAGELAGELRQIDHLGSRIRTSSGGKIVLARADSAVGRRLLRQHHVTLPREAEAEGYALIVTPRQAAVVGATAAGVLYGVETLRQLIHPAGGGEASVPAVTIVDWPALRWRTIQIDLSRGPVPSLAAFERDLPLLAEFKVNGLVLYFENTFAYPDMPVWAMPGGAITPEEAKKIVADAARYHITVIPEQEAFGHLHLGLREERYQDLLETPYGAILSPAAPASLDFIGKMFAQLAAVFPGPFFHIGADETAGLGSGRSQAMLQSEGAGPLYLNYVKAIDERLKPYNRRVLFWGDIAQAHPELLQELPHDMIAVPWDYSPRASFVKLIRPFTDAGLDTWVAPGVSNWSRIFPDYNQAIPNITNFVRDGRRLGATGLINTNWDDDGESFLDYCWYGLAYGGAAGWEDAPDLARFDEDYDWAVYRADGHAFDQQIQTMDAIHKLLESAIHADGADRLMWHQAFSPAGQKLYLAMAPASHQMRVLAEDVIASLADHRDEARRNAWSLDAVEFAARRFDFVGEKAIYTAYITDLYAQAAAPGAKRGDVRRMLGRVNAMNGLLQDMRDGASSLERQYQALWLEGNTQYFLPNILLRYQDEAMYWQHEARRFDRIASAYGASGTLPPLVEPNEPASPASTSGSGGERR
ncbi:MAG: glycoside hydrolase family 20 zincin-like fold domain-containing protein [Terriglobales bacterium]